MKNSYEVNQMANKTFTNICDLIKIIWQHDANIKGISLFYKLCFNERAKKNMIIPDAMLAAFKVTLTGKENMFLNKDIKEASNLVVKYNEKITFSFTPIFNSKTLTEVDKINVLNRLAFIYYLTFGSEKIKEMLQKESTQQHKLTKKSGDLSDKIMDAVEQIHSSGVEVKDPMTVMASLMSGGMLQNLMDGVEDDDGGDKMLDMAENMIKGFRGMKNNTEQQLSRDNLKRMMKGEDIKLEKNEPITAASTAVVKSSTPVVEKPKTVEK